MLGGCRPSYPVAATSSGSLNLRDTTLCPPPLHTADGYTWYSPSRSGNAEIAAAAEGWHWLPCSFLTSLAKKGMNTF